MSTAPAPIRWSEIVAEVAAAGRFVRRAWPRSTDHLLLELGSRDPGTDPRPPVPAQWFGSAATTTAEAVRSPGSVQPQDAAARRLLLHPGGADRRLPGLAQLLADPETTVLSHRPGRRAVLRRRCSARGTHTFTKVVRPNRLAALADRARYAASLDLVTPTVLDVDPVAGSVTTGAVPGSVLTDVLGEPGAESACRSTGAALARLHRQPIPVGLDRHDLRAEHAVLDRWLHLVDHFAPPAPFGGRWGRPAGSPTAGGSLGEASVRPTLLHRDFHDGQVLVDGDRIGVIDFDLMAVGDPALDLGNLLAHLELRALQGVVDDAAPLVAAVLDGYRPAADVRRRLAGYRALARQRLAALYAFRSADVIT